MMERRFELEERRIDLDEEFSRKRDELGNSPDGQDENAWQELDQEQQRTFEALDEQHQALDQESQAYWETREEEHRKREEEEIGRASCRERV